MRTEFPEGIQSVVTDAQNGDADALNRMLVYTYPVVKDRVEYYLSRYGAAVCDDAVQHVITRIYRKFSQCRPETFAGWVKAVVRTSIVNFLRHRKIRFMPTLDIERIKTAVHTGPDPIEQAGKIAAVHAALNKLSESDQKILQLYYLVNRTQKIQLTDLQRLMSVDGKILPLSTIKRRLSMARTRMKKHILAAHGNNI